MRAIVTLLIVLACTNAHMFEKKNMRQVRNINIAKGSLATLGELGHQVAIIDIPSNSQFCGASSYFYNNLKK
jgi:secreted trypsin-like serine protease